MVADWQRVVRWPRMYMPRVVGGLAILTVALVTGRVSYVHIRDLSLLLHQPPSLAWLIPFGVDGLIVVGSVVLLQARGALGWLCVGPGVAISLFANVESGLRYGPLAAAWAAVSAVSFALSTFTFERWLAGMAATVEESGSGVFTGDSPVREGGRIATLEPAGTSRSGTTGPRTPGRDSNPRPGAEGETSPQTSVPGRDAAPGGPSAPVVVPAKSDPAPIQSVTRPGSPRVTGGQGQRNREAILAFLAAHPDWRTREKQDIAAELGLHPITLRRHLQAMNGSAP